jgi:release factor glutamine methyltransferase
MLEQATGRSRLELLSEPERTLGRSIRALLVDWIHGRAQGVPLQHLLGVAPFWGLDLEAGPEALVPRPETERLVELVVHGLVGRAAPIVLDLGTGSGAIAIAVARERPDAEVWASEVDAGAAALARRNLARFAPAVRLVQADLFRDETLRGLLPRLDALVANLPYLPDADADALPREVRRDPPRALFAGRDGLALLRRAWGEAEEALAPGADAWFELDPRNVESAAAWIGGRGAARGRPVEVHDDLTGRARFVRVGARR